MYVGFTHALTLNVLVSNIKLGKTKSLSIMWGIPDLQENQTHTCIYQIKLQY